MKRISLTQYRTVNGKWQFVPVARDDAGNPRPTQVIVKGEAISSSAPGGGKFYLDYRDEEGKRVRTPCGVSPREALDAWKTQSGIANGTIEPSAIGENPGERATVADGIKQFLSEVNSTKSTATYQAYSKDSAWFSAKLNRHYVDQVSRADILRVFGCGRDEKLSQRTINRRVLVGLMALRNAGSTLKLKKGDWPKTTEQEVEVYSEEELRKFFAACTDRGRLIFQTYLLSGFRNREVATLTWDSVDFSRGRLSVKARPQFAFKPKNYEVRSVPVPQSLLSALKAHKKQSMGTLVFPTPPHPKRPNYGGERPDTHHLEMCKEIAYHAKLNCGHCLTRQGKCAKGPYCEKFYLHKFRDSFATGMLRSNIDIKTLQRLLGHKHLQTTERYLAAVKDDQLFDQVESSALARLMA